jgi:hypothetical protein
MEARKLLTAMAVGSIGVLYVTLTGKDATALSASGKTLAILAIIAMGLSAAFGFAAWRYDSLWAYERATDSAHGAEKWHTRKKACDLTQLALFALGVAAAMVLTIAIVLLK